MPVQPIKLFSMQGVAHEHIKLFSMQEIAYEYKHKQQANENVIQ